MRFFSRLLRLDPDSREGIIAGTSALGIAVNVLIAAVKVIVGAMASSIAIISEGINNASDALTAVLTLVGSRLASRHPDEKHPFGYGRIEYLTGLVVGILIIITGVETLKTSIETIFEPAELSVSYLSLAVVAFSAVIKYLLGSFTLRMGKKADSSALVGVGERTDDPQALNALPASWREMLDETRFKAKLYKCLAVAGGIWALIMLVLFGVPVVYGFLTDHQKTLSKQHARQYNAVKEMKAKVDLVRKYSDHARGALEIMKALSDRLPEGVTLANWDYRRDDGVRVKGDADTAEATYAFKDAMDAMSAGDDDDAEPIFGEVLLSGPNASKNKYVFNLDCQYQKEEVE